MPAMLIHEPQESSSVTYGKTEIPYRIRRSKSRQTVAVTVEPDEGVVLVAPVDTDVPRLDQVVQQKAAWILDKLRHVGGLDDAPCEREFVSGESFWYLGRTYRLKVIESDRADSVVLDDDRLVVALPQTLGDDDQARLVRGHIESWYTDAAETLLRDRVAHWAERSGLRPESVMIRAQKKRWASCDSQGNLRLNWRIIQAPQSLIDYIIVHELAHLRHKDHTKTFWSLLGTHMPDYEARKEELRVLGPRWVW